MKFRLDVNGPEREARPCTAAVRARLAELRTRSALPFSISGWVRRGMPLLVGEAPGPPPASEDPRLALTGAAGKRLAALARLRWPDGYLGRVGRINLIDRWPGRTASGGSAFDAEAAADSAHALALLAMDLSRRVGDIRLVLLGRRVQRAFGFRSVSLMDEITEQNICVDGREAARVFLFPHPSGLNRRFNGKRERRRLAALFMRQLGLVRKVFNFHAMVGPNFEGAA